MPASEVLAIGDMSVIDRTIMPQGSEMEFRLHIQSDTYANYDEASTNERHRLDIRAYRRFCNEVRHMPTSR